MSFFFKKCCKLLIFSKCLKEATARDCATSTEAEEMYALHVAFGASRIGMGPSEGVADCESRISESECLNQNSFDFVGVVSFLLVAIIVVVVDLYCCFVPNPFTHYRGVTDPRSFA